MQVVPWQKLSPEALRGIIMDVITREGTNVHDSDTFTAEHTFQRVLDALKSNTLVLIFEEESGTCAIVSPDTLDP